MLFVSIIQFVAVGFTITALVKNTLMLSPEQHGVTCNITSRYFPKKNITAEHLAVYWGWSTLEIRWDFEGLTDTQIWLRETYSETYNYRCENSSNNITIMPTPSPTPKPTRATKSPTQSQTTNNNTYIINNYKRRLNNIQKCEEYNSEEVPLPMRYTKYYPFNITTIYNSEEEVYYSNDLSDHNNSTQKEGCDELQIVIETGKSYFSLLVCGLFFECIGLILLIFPTCHLINVSQRRLFKQIVIGLNTVSFMLLLMAFAIWFAYFSTNINQVIESEGGNNFSVCILGEPIFGESIAYLLSGWLLIGVATMATCYLSNRPKKWYRWLRNKRHFNWNKQQQMKIQQVIEEEEEEEEEEYESTSQSSSSNANQNHLINQTPSDNSDGYTESFMTADSGSFGNIVMKGDTYPSTYSPN